MIGEPLAEHLQRVDWLPLPNLQQLQRAEISLQQQGARRELVGHSLSGKEMHALILEPESFNADKTLLAWGFPHPDEPLGAAALIWMAEQWLAGELAELQQWRLVLLLCADPDQVERQLWLPHDSSPVDAFQFVQRSFSPIRLGLEVEYGFPVSYQQLQQPEDYQGRCRRQHECSHWECPPVYGPLPESIAISQLLRKYRPQLVAAMHSEHTGGDYTFLLKQEDEQTLHDLQQIPNACGSVRHLGEQLDPGQRFSADPDILAEATLQNRLERLQQHPQFIPSAEYLGNVSAAMHIQSLGLDAQFVCPETTIFKHKAFADTSLTPYTRRQLAEVAITQRNDALAAVEHIYHSLEAAVYHPYVDEVLRPAREEEAPTIANYQGADYQRLATVAEQATFEWFWPMHTAQLVGKLNNFLLVQPHSEQIKEAMQQVLALQQQLLSPLPKELLHESDRPAAIRSQLARLFRLMRNY